MMEMIETGTYRSVPRKISDLKSFVTQDRDLFVLAHLGIPRVTREVWRLSVEGMVTHRLSLGFEDLASFPTREVMSFHKCAGNPMRPAEPTPDRVGNVIWRGVRLRDVLARSGYDAGASHIWADGHDGGSFEGVSVVNYQKDLPIAKALADEVLLAFEINGEPLSVYRGGPARLVVPGWYATNSVKWLRALHVADRRAEGPFTTTWYNDREPSGARHPVWAIAPDSAIVTPVSGDSVDAGRLMVEGWSWGEQDIVRVDISTDSGAAWQAAELSPRVGKSWQHFSAEIRVERGGPLTIISRATDAGGNVQPMSGARNASVAVEIGVRG
jgi:DMSO/TMAO reductase YedYZ molybdopterin-dependent catalytic subunit